MPILRNTEPYTRKHWRNGTRPEAVPVDTDGPIPPVDEFAALPVVDEIPSEEG